jgi:hypothetical protein
MSRNAAPPLSSSKCAAWALERERRPFTDPIEIPGARADGGEVVVPPQVLLARRRAAFSMCSGQGRTLKGRDLRRVRDSVLRMTGFIES